jgi:hypothetical protein
MNTTNLDKRFPNSKNAHSGDRTGDKPLLSTQLRDLRSQRSIISWEIRKVKAKLAGKTKTKSAPKRSIVKRLK